MRLFGTIRSHSIGTLLCSVAALGPALAQDAPPPTPASSLERGAYAEEHELDLERAKGFYEEALASAETMGDLALAAEARNALERLKRRQGDVPSEGDEAVVRERVEERIGEVLKRLSDRLDLVERYGAGVQTQQGAQVHLPTEYRAAGAELALFGEAAVELLEACFDGSYQKVGGQGVRLRAQDVAAILVAMQGGPADGALERAVRSPNALVRRETMRASDPERHHHMLVAGASDQVRGVREGAIGSLARAPRPNDLPLFRTALDEGMVEAVDAVFRLAPQELFERALAADAPAWVTDALLSRLGQQTTPPPPLLATRLLVRELLREPNHGKRTNFFHLLHELAQSPLLEEARAELESAVLAHVNELQADWTMTLLAIVGRMPSIAALPPAMIASGILYDAAEDWLRTCGTRVRREDVLAVARYFQELPLPEAFEGEERGRANGVLARLAQGMSGLPWPEEDPQLLIECWNLLDEGHRPVFVSVLAHWMEQNEELRMARAGGDYSLANRPGSLDARALPMARSMVLAADEGIVALGLRALQAIGSVDALREQLAFATSAANTTAQNTAETGARAVVALDPTAARSVIVQAILDGWRLRPGAPPIGASALRFLPDAQVIEAFHAIWPKTAAGDSLRVDLLEQLAERESARDATALLVEHYRELPADRSDLRESVLGRIGAQLYEPGIELLGDGLRDVDVSVRAVAFNAFQHFQSQAKSLDAFEAWRSGADSSRDSAAELLELLASDSRDVRIGAVQALGALRAKQALPKLVRLLEEDDADLRNAVRAAIARMSD